MEIKAILYIFVLGMSVWALDSVRLNEIFKKNRNYQAITTYALLAMSISYLVTNFIYDLFLSTKFI